MKKIVLMVTLILALILMSSVSAQEVCEYNGLKTEYGYNYQEPGAKVEYGEEKFVHLTDAKAVKNLEQMKGLVCLEFADFYNQGVSGKVESLKNLVNLEVLNLHTNPEVEGDVCVFSKATKLKSLKLAFDEKVYGDISCLKELNLETLAMTYTKITGDLSDLSQMTDLKALYLSGTDVGGDVSALSGLTNLEELTLSDAEMDGSKFYGDLASLDNLKKLRRVALYNTKVTNCEHFQKMRPEIEGGCSEESKFTVVDTNVESEKIIGKGSGDVSRSEQQQAIPDENPPPGECIINGEFIGEDKCQSLVGKTSSESPSQEGPPEECIVDRQFIGEEACRALVDKASSGKSPGGGPPSECIVEGKFIGEDKCRALKEETSGRPLEVELRETKGFLQRVIDWLSSLFG